MMHGRIAATLLLIAVGCGGTEATLEDQTADELFAAHRKLWPSLEIPVCWIAPDPGRGVERSWVQDQVQRTWSTAAPVRFTGWGTCQPGQATGVRIMVADENPWSLIGTDANLFSVGTSGASMLLNFSFVSWGPTCQSTIEFCIRAGAAHEFGHALGFDHEQNRPDNPNQCPKDTIGTTGDWLLGQYDTSSVMNYCAPAWNNNGNLSAGDIAGVRAAYPATLGTGCGLSPSRCKNDDLLVDFGPPHGLWLRRNEAEWIQVHGTSTRLLASGDLDGDGRSDPLIDFGSPHGLWLWRNGQSWQQIHGTSAEAMVGADLDGDGRSEYVIDFGAQYGLWVYQAGGAWRLLHGTSPRQVVAANLDLDRRQDLIVDFSSQGIWILMNNTSWVPLHGLGAEEIAAGNIDNVAGDEVIVDFGPNRGLWVWFNQSAWVQLHARSPVHISAAQLDANPRAELISDFGSGSAGGIWVLYNYTSWVSRHGTTSESLGAADLDRNGQAELLVDFGAPYGLWAWRNNSTWVLEHGTTPVRWIAVDAR